MTKYCERCKKKIYESSLGEFLGNKNYAEYKDGYYCLDCDDDLKRRFRKEK